MSVTPPLSYCEHGVCETEHCRTCEIVQGQMGIRDDLLAIIEAAGRVRMFEGRSYRELWSLLDAATDRWFSVVERTDEPLAETRREP